MQALTFWKTVIKDNSGFLENLFFVLENEMIEFCVIDDYAVSAYIEPLVSLDLDIVVAVDQIEKVETLFEKQFTVKSFPHSLNITIPNSDVRVQVQTDKRYSSFLENATMKSILGMDLPVASIEDVLQGKIWAVSDTERRGSKRQKDLADIARILESYPELREKVPQEIRNLLLD
jgi:hypothetical protein